MISWLKRLWATLRPGRLDAGIEDELRLHMEERIEENMTGGMSREEARRDAQRRFGNPTSLKESTRETEILVWLETALQDLRYALRGFGRSPGFAATAILSLALGIGANTALFSLLDALMLRMLPVEAPEQLVEVRFTDYTHHLSYPLFDALRKQSKTLSEVAALNTYSQMTIEERGEKRKARVQMVSSNYFDLLGVNAERGNVFHADASPHETIAVISDAYWRMHYGASRDAVGAHFRFSERDFTIAGVAPHRFRGVAVDDPIDIWVSIEQTFPASSGLFSPNTGWLHYIGRKKRGMSDAQVDAESNSLLHGYLEQSGAAQKFRNAKDRDLFYGRRFEVVSGEAGISDLRDRFAKPLFVLEGIVAVVLLIACANLANLMLARASAREKEFATRRALGAGRGRLIRQLLTESLLLAAAGAGAALLVARWMNAALLRFLPPDAAPSLDRLSFHPSARMLVFTASIALLTCAIFAVGPAASATRAIAEARSRWPAILVIGEVTLCTVLLIGSGLFVRSLYNLEHLDPGFAREHVAIASIVFPDGITNDQRQRKLAAMRDQIAAQPGVAATGFSSLGVLSGSSVTTTVTVPWHTPRPDEDLNVVALGVSPGYFEAMGTPLRAGRDFTGRDDEKAPLVAIVNEAFVRQFMEGIPPLGKKLTGSSLGATEPLQIVGVVKDVKYGSMRETPKPIIYVPFRLGSYHWSTFVVRSAADFSPVVSYLRSAAAEQKLKLGDITPLTEIVDRTLATERMVAQISGAFGALALLVACIGSYGVLAYRVARRTREIGVRMALGATGASVVWMILRESLTMLACGIALGVPLALLLTRLLTAMLYGLTPDDPSTISVALGALALVSLAAALIPARRAAQVDPMTALRCE